MGDITPVLTSEISRKLLSQVDKGFIEFQLSKKINSKKEILKIFVDKKNKKVDPNNSFNSDKYLNDNPDVEQFDLHPFVHFLMHGQKEHRKKYQSKLYSSYLDSSSFRIPTKASEANLSFALPYFNQSFYQKRYPGSWGWDHYLSHGQFENKVPAEGIIPETLDKFFRDSKEEVPLLQMVQVGRDAENYNLKEKPKYSVVILNWNKALMTIQCVFTLFKNSKYQDIEIIIVDNGSNDEDFTKLLSLKKISRVKIIRLKTNRFFGEANNLGVEASSSNVICLLNNDAFVNSNWDEHLLSVLNSNKEVGAVGPKFLFPNGVLQEAGGELSSCGQNIQKGKGLNPNLEFFNVERDVSHISAACIMLNKDTFYRVNGFDYRYEPAYFEDADLSAKILSIGKKIRYVPQAEIVHVENATSKDERIGFSFNNLIKTNRSKFVERWGRYLSGGESPMIKDNREAYKASSKNGNAPKAIVYSPYDLTPGGGERYILSAAISFRDKGYQTFFASPIKYSVFRFLNIAEELGLNVEGISLLSAKEMYRQKNVEVFFVMSNELSPVETALGSKLNIYHCQFPFPMSSWHKANCLDNVEDYDCVVVNSNFTKRIYQKEAKKLGLNIPDVHIVSPPISAIKKVEKPKDGIIRVLNVGRFIAGGHCKKQREIVLAFNRLSELLEEKGIKSKLTLVGSIGSNEEDRNYLNVISNEIKSDVEIVLNASREDLITKYQAANFYWHGTGINEDVEKNPEVFEHFGISPIEGVSAGCIPVVWHEGGPAEIIKNSIKKADLFLASSINDYVSKTFHLIEKGYSDDFNEIINTYLEKPFHEKINALLN